MIAPAYRRDQLWSPPRRSPGGGLAFGLAFGFVVAINIVAPARVFCTIRDTPEDRARVLVTRLVSESFPEWREQHAGCPRRLSELLPGTQVDPWGHALHYTCDPRLAGGGLFAVFSAGPDGRFGTPDDIEAHP